MSSVATKRKRRTTQGREAIVAALDAQLKKGDKALIGTPPIGAICAKSGPKALTHSRSMRASSPRRRASTGFSSCAPTRR